MSVVKFDQLNIKNIVFEPLKDSTVVTSQKIGYIKYKADDEEEASLKVQSPTIDFETYGIPRDGPYYPDDKSRSFFKFPFCHDRKLNPAIDYDKIEMFYNKFVEIDEYCSSDEFRKTMFGEKQYNKYQYVPLVRIPEIDDDEGPKLDKNGEPYYSPPYTKIKFFTDSDSEDSKYPKYPVKLFERVNGSRNQIMFTSFDDFVKNIKYRSKLRFIISFGKLYAMKNANGGEKKKYGITLKATHIEIERSNMVSSTKQNIDAFVDSDTDEAINENVISISRKKSTVSQLDEDINSDEVVEDIKPKQKSTNQQLDEDSEEFVEDIKSKPKSSKKEQLDEDEDEELVEDIKPKSKAKKAKAINANK